MVELSKDIENKNLSKDNARLGAKIQKNGKSYFIYKVNIKSFYYGEETYVVISKKWENKEKGITWKEFMEINGGKQSIYQGFLLEKLPEIAYEADATKSKKPLTPLAEKEIVKLYNRFIEDKGKSYRHTVEVGSKTFKIIAANKDKQVLLSLDGNYVFFDLEQDKYTKWREIKIGGQKEIPWPQKAESISN